MQSNILFYKKPAESYMEALPLGNGSMGAMCYSGVKNDRLSLNHDTLWSGHPRTVTREGAYESYKRAQSLASRGLFQECRTELEENFLTCWSQAYLTFGCLDLVFDIDGYEMFDRRLDLSRAVLTSSFSSKGKRYEKTAFISYPNDVLVYKIESPDAEFSFAASFDCPLKHTVTRIGETLTVDGECPGDGDTYSDSYPCNALIYSDDPKEKGVLFRGALRVTTDGEVSVSDRKIEVSNASSAVLLFNISTSFNGFDKFPAIDGKEYKNAALTKLAAAVGLGFDALLDAHVRDFKRLYDRVSLKLGSDNKDELPTDERLKRFLQDRSDLALYALMFNFGRYLLISSSRPGSTATNLQGIWNNSVKPPWNSNYTLNINTQMNYWPVMPCALPELVTPLVDLLKALSVTGETTAKEFYNAGGFVVHHNADIWGHSTPVYGHAVYAFWQGGSGWLCQNLFDAYAYTLDKDFLKNTALPIMKKAARFYLDVLVEDADGSLIISPATSPENSFIKNGRIGFVSRSAANMNSIVSDLLKNCKKACEELDIADEFYDEVCRAADRIKPLQIGENGAILEWDGPFEETDAGHRHLSHLYALYPAGLITKETNGDLFNACKKTLEIRGDDGTGWSIAWKAVLWARLRDGDHALRLIDRKLALLPAEENDRVVYTDAGGTFPNMLDAHPPFQIDGNFGVTGALCEMLLQSDGENIYLLPALPERWKNGKVTGLAARGNAAVDIEWNDGKITDYAVHSDNKFNIILCR